MGLAVAACAPAGAPESTASPTSTTSVATTAASSTVSPTIPRSTAPTIALATPTPSPEPATTVAVESAEANPVPVAAVAAARFTADAKPIDADRAGRMKSSWRPGCPIGLEDLRYVTVTHWDFTGAVVTGELVVHRDHADSIIAVMERLFDVGFPIERMELIDVYDGDDDRSMAANNTSAFNCREVAWRPGVWSNHALGEAIDINPLTNPYVSDTVVLPPAGVAFADRAIRVPGGIYAGDDVVRAFAEVGWGWGGDWPAAKDWQHFSASGR